MNFFRTKTRIGLGAAAALLLALFAGLLIYAHTDAAHERLRSRLNAAIPGAISWERLDLSLIRGRVEIVGLRVEDPEAVEAVAADRLGLRLAWTALATGTLRVREFSLDAPRVDLRADADGRLNLLRAFVDEDAPPREEPKDEGGGLPLDIRVDRAILSDGHFVFSRPAGAETERISLRGIHLSVRDMSLSDRRGQLELRVDGGEMDMAGLASTLRKLELAVGLDGDRIEPLRLALDADGPSLTLTGSADDLSGTPVLDLTLDLSADLAVVSALAGLGDAFSGPATLKLVVSGAPGNPAADLTATYGGGLLGGRPVDALNLRGRLADRRFDLSELSFAAPGADLSLTGEADFSEAFPEGFPAGPTNLDALTYRVAIDRAGVRMADLLPDAGLAGTVRLDGAASGRGVSADGLRVAADLKARAEGFAAGEILAPVDAELDLTAAFAGGRATAEALDLRVAGARLSATGAYRLADRAADAEIRLIVPNLTDLMAPLGIAQLAGSADLSATVAGDVLAPSIDLTLSGENVAWNAIRVGAVRLAAVRESGGRVRMDELALENRDSRLRAEGIVELFRDGWGIREGLPAELVVTLSGVSAVDFLPEVPVAGSVDGEIRLSGPLLGPDRIDARLTADRLASGETVIGRVAATAVLADGTLRLDPLTVANGESRVRLAGTAGLFVPGSWRMEDDPAFDLTLDADPVHPGEFAETLGGTATLSARVGGTLSAPTADGNLSAVDLSVGDLRIGNVAADLRMADGRMTLEPLTVENRRSAARLAGTVRLLDPETLAPLESPILDLRLAADPVHPGDFRDDLDGTLSLSAEIQGSVRAPEATATLRGSGLAVAGTRIGTLNADLAFSGGQLAIRSLSLENGGSALDVSGTARLMDPETLAPLAEPRFDLRAEGDPIRLEDFVSGMKGRIDLTADVSGTPRALRGAVSLSGDALDFGAQKVDSIRVAARLEGERVRVAPAVLTLREGDAVRAEGWYVPADGRYDLRIRTDGVSLAAIDALRARDFESGRVRFDLAGAGRVSRPSAQGEVRIEGVRINGEDLAPLRLRLEVADGTARIVGNADFAVDLRYDLDSRDFSADLRFADTALGPYFQMLGQPALDGTISAAATARGNAGNPGSIVAEVRVDRLSVVREGAALATAVPFEASLREGRLSVPGLRLDLPEQGFLTVSGNGRLDGELDFRVEGRIPMDAARSPGLDLDEATGILTLDARVGGTAERPEVDATLALAEVGFVVPGLAQKLSGLDGTLRVTRDRIVLENLAGRLDDGRFSLTGSADLADFRPGAFSARLEARRLPVSVPETLDLVLNADISLAGNPEKSRLDGEVTLLEGLYYRDVDLSLTGAVRGDRRRTESPGSGEPPSPLLAGMALDVVVRHRNPLVVDNNVALLTVRPDLRLRGTAARPLLNGRAEIPDGTVTYQRTEFEVERGVIDFLNPYRIEPTLDIRAVSEVRKWTIVLTVSGTPDNLGFRLSSTPRESDEDILSLLLLGRTTGELVRQEGGSSFSARQMVGDIVSGALSRNLRDATGLDVELGYDAGDGSDSGGVDVTVGKELSRRVTVKYGVESRGGNVVHRGTAEYKFLENLIMSAFEDSEGNFGGELIFRMEFR
jgi:translocation and assembly module TamB